MFWTVLGVIDEVIKKRRSKKTLTEANKVAARLNEMYGEAHTWQAIRNVQLQVLKGEIVLPTHEAAYDAVRCEAMRIAEEG